MVRPGIVVALFGLVALRAQPAYALERAARPMGLYPVNAASPLAMVDSRIELTVRGPIIEAVVVQRYRNTTDRATEATYIFPLPPDAAVSAMAIQIGGRTIRAAIERRDAALRRYEAAVAAGVAGALLEQERADVFTQNIAAIPVNAAVEVTLRYDTVARYQAGAWELVIPMVVAPRYVPGTASGRATTGSGSAPDTDRSPDASRITPAASPGAGGSTAVVIHFVDPAAELTSPTHELGGSSRDATLSDPHSDHDAIVRWRAAAPAAGWVERDGDAGFAAVLVEAAPPGARKAPIRVVLAIDRAPTVRGDGDAVEHPLVRALLGALDRGDRVRVIGSDAIAWSARDEARQAIERAWSTPAGVFDLTRVLEGARPDGAAIVLVSDGLVADDEAAIAAAARLAVPVHVIGIGPAPARATLRRIAAASGGTVRFAAPGDDLTALAVAALADVGSPPQPFTVTWGALVASDVEPAVLPRLGAGQAGIVLARIHRAQAANARARGELFAFEALTPARPVEGATTSHGPLARRWARERVADLVAGHHDRAAVTSLALSYGLVSPYTSLVAVGSDVVVQGGVTHSIAVPVAVPSGMQWQAIKPAIEVDTRAGAKSEVAPPHHGHTEPRAPAPAPVGTKKPRPAPKKHRLHGDDAEDDDRARNDRGPPASPTLDQSGTSPADGSAADKDAAPPVAPEPRSEREPEPEGGAFKAAQSIATATGGEVADAETIVETAASHRAWRLSTALAGGLAFDHGARGLLALDVRLESTRTPRLGGELALWLTGGGAEGRALVTFARTALAGWLELGLGAGGHLGHDSGLATSLRLLARTPISGLAGALRYDAALLLTRPSVEAEHVLTLGLELSY